MPKRVNLIVLLAPDLFRTGLVNVLQSKTDFSIKVVDISIAVIDKNMDTQTETIIIPIELTNQHGNDLLKKISKQSNVIVFSDLKCDDEVIKDLFNRGANAYFDKSIEVQQLIELISLVSLKKNFVDNLSLSFYQEDIHARSLKIKYTNAERRLIQYLSCPSLSYNEIATKLFVSKKTVENQVDTLYKKIGIKNRAEFIVACSNTGLKFISCPWIDI